MKVVTAFLQQVQTCISCAETDKHTNLQFILRNVYNEVYSASRWCTGIILTISQRYLKMTDKQHRRKHLDEISVEMFFCFFLRFSQCEALEK